MNKATDLNIDVSEAIEKYSDTVRRICYLNLKNKSDVEDVFQEVFLKFFVHYDSFESEEHKKAWLCKVAFNQCKDHHKSFWQRNVSSLENLNVDIPYETPEQSDLIEAVLRLQPNWKQVIYLHYYEDMTIPQIASIMGKKVNTVYTYLRRAKEKLRNELKEDYFNGNA